ncbi:carbohydrate ABC transporter permease [Promicromonospora kroppenstedtii]|uniref:Carbohydrate ABC transporter permease n=1 Tax=Promicromonospora kroppenstedtii TaxID=440482 RepID=A0ABW7XRV1_9MICO|nr:carbohydrate ABC transporter permease [Promicromonospora kroppenstedtii]
MSTVEAATPAPEVPRRTSSLNNRARKARKALSNPWASTLAVVIAILWTLPTVGLLITSFRPELDIRQSGWWTVFGSAFAGEGVFSLKNYETALFDGSTNLAVFFVNSFVVTLPAVFIPITLALLAAYGFAWVDFKGADFLFIAVFALQIVPIQITLVPLLSAYVDLGINGSFWTIWLSHSIFALPLAIFLLHNFMKEIPRSLIEAARMDGAGHVQVFFRVVLPLLTPALAAFAIFQFLWVWNDLLVALVMGDLKTFPLTVRVAELAGSRGGDWHVLSAGAFISMVVPLIVFLSLQRYFVRGLLAGSVKG